jgi:hypothetical protein
VSLVHKFRFVRFVLTFLKDLRSSIKRVARHQAEDKPTQDERSECEDCVTEHPHPPQIRQDGGVEEFG